MTIENLKVSETPVKSNKWDRIKRKYSSNVNLNSETVKKFLQTEFISDQSMKLMKGDSKSLDSLNALNPAIVMDLRHELVSEFVSFNGAFESRKLRLCLIMCQILDSKIGPINNSQQQFPW